MGNDPAFPHLVAWLTAAWLSCAMSVASAQIVANFDEGNTSLEVDGVPGMAGEGWSNAWNDIGQGAAATWSALDSDPLQTGTGYYLSWSFTNPHASSARSRNIRRSYTDTDLISLNAAHTIQFLHRLDALTSGAAFIADTDPAITNAFYDATTSTWIAATTSSGMEWIFGDGNGIGGSGAPNDPVHSGVNVALGDVYSFVIELDPANNRYKASVTNLDFDSEVHTGNPTFQSDWLNFDNADGTVFGNLVAGGRIGAQTTVAHSLDSIAIVPEPATIALFAGIAGLLFAAARNRRMRLRD